MRESTELVDEDTYVPAIVATLAWIGIGIILDVYLIVTCRRRLISDVFRTKPGKAFLGMFCLHVVDRLGRADPFHLVGKTVTFRVTTAENMLVNVGLTEIPPISK